MNASRTLRMGAMERWGGVRIAVMSANDQPGTENARLRVMSPGGSSTVRIELGESIEIEGVGTVALDALHLHHPGAGDDGSRAGRGSVEVTFEPADG